MGHLVPQVDFGFRIFSSTRHTIIGMVTVIFIHHLSIDDTNSDLARHVIIVLFLALLGFKSSSGS